MPAVTKAPNAIGDFLVDYEEKVFEDVKADPGDKALVTFHTVAFEGSIGFVNLLQATRLQRKGFDTLVLLYGPGVTLGVQRGFPTLGDEAFPGHQNFNNTLTKFMAEGGREFGFVVEHGEKSARHENIAGHGMRIDHRHVEHDKTVGARKRGAADQFLSDTIDVGLQRGVARHQRGDLHLHALALGALFFRCRGADHCHP